MLPAHLMTNEDSCCLYEYGNIIRICIFTIMLSRNVVVTNFVIISLSLVLVCYILFLNILRVNTVVGG